MEVIELTVVPLSLRESVAMCEWASMSPGVTNLPETSTTSAPVGMATSAPTAAIRPSRSRTVPPGIVPWVTVSTVPPRSATTGDPVCARTEVSKVPPCSSTSAAAMARPGPNSSRRVTDVVQRISKGGRRTSTDSLTDHCSKWPVVRQKVAGQVVRMKRSFPRRALGRGAPDLAFPKHRNPATP